MYRPCAINTERNGRKMVSRNFLLCNIKGSLLKFNQNENSTSLRFAEDPSGKLNFNKFDLGKFSEL